MPASAEPSVRPRRSALYLPASNARAIEKARELPCDVVILDLEDAVAPDAKDAAREQAVQAVRAGGFGRREVVIRVNGLDTPWGGEDLDAAGAAGADAVLAPKVSSPQDVAGYTRPLAGRTRLWCMIETCAALFRLDALGAACAEAGVACWVMGTNDLAKEMRCQPGPDRAPLAAALSLSVAAARLHGLAILDGVFNDIADEAGFGAQCAQALAFGFDGKTLIHPSQVAAANQVFAPSEAQVRWSRLVVDAFDQPQNAARGALKVEGRMVERLHLAEARRVLALAEALGG